MKKLIALILALGLVLSFAACGKEEEAPETVDTSDYIPIVAGYGHTLALTKDRKVLDMGFGNDGQRDVQDWTDIIALGAGGYHSVGLKADGTVVATGANGAGQCDVQDWKDITQIAVGCYHSAGLKKDGTVVPVVVGEDPSDPVSFPLGFPFCPFS